MGSLADRMLKRLYAGPVHSRLTEPDVQVSPSQPWFATCELAGAQRIFMMRWQACYRTVPRSYPPVTRFGEELTVTTELWSAAAKSQPLQIGIDGSRTHGMPWPLYCRVLVFKYSETEL